MRLGIVGWFTNSGLGTEAIDAIRNLPVVASLALPNGVKPTRRDILAKFPHMEAPQGRVYQAAEEWVKKFKPDTVLSWEIPGDWRLPSLWSKLGIRWFQVIHWDWFYADNLETWRPARLISPNRLCQRELTSRGLTSDFLPVPIDLRRFVFRERKKCSKFLSIVGYGGANGRRGLPELFDAYKRGKNLPPLVLPAQRTTPDLRAIPPGVSVPIQDVEDMAALYELGDVAVQPSRFEGVGLTLLEAQACGLPVVTVDAEPMNWMAPDLLVPVWRREFVRIANKTVTANVVDPVVLAAMMEKLGKADISELSRAARARVEKEFSWDVLRDRWVSVLEGGKS